jgi:hypothetical protein
MTNDDEEYGIRSSIHQEYFMTARAFRLDLIGRLVLAALLLSGCTTYQRYEGADAARLRISSSFMHMVPFLQRVDASGICGERFQAAVLVPPTEAPRGGNATGPAATEPARQPREDMLESTPATQANITELKLPPGRFWLQSAATPKFEKLCAFAVEFQLEPGRQHWLDLSSDGVICKATLSRVEGPVGGERWSAAPLQRKTASCAK